MATNTPAKQPNIKRYTCPAATEETIDFEGIVAVIGFSLQAVDNVNVRVSFDPGGTFSADNYWTLKAGDIWNERDINWVHAERLYVRSEGAATTVEVIYWG